MQYTHAPILIYKLKDISHISIQNIPPAPTIKTCQNILFYEEGYFPHPPKVKKTQSQM